MSVKRAIGPLQRTVLCLAVLAAATGAVSEDNRFMPRGGRTLLLEAIRPSPDELLRIAQTRNTEAQWAQFVAERGNTLSEREASTLSAYLAVNLPLPASALRAGKPEALSAALPRDGRELAWDQCQFCHSLFTSHLTQSRDAQGWRNMFESPFHRGLKMTPQEREEFARYSAINMPMKIDDVPAELRF